MCHKRTVLFGLCMIGTMHAGPAATQNGKHTWNKIAAAWPSMREGPACMAATAPSAAAPITCRPMGPWISMLPVCGRQVGPASRIIAAAQALVALPRELCKHQPGGRHAPIHPPSPTHHHSAACMHACRAHGCQAASGAAHAHAHAERVPHKLLLLPAARRAAPQPLPSSSSSRPTADALQGGRLSSMGVP